MPSCPPLPRPASRICGVGLLAVVLLSCPAPGAADSPPPLAELPGPLVLAGGEPSDDVRDAFSALAGKDKAKIVVIPTAGNDADDPDQADAILKPWKDREPASVVILHTRERDTADDPSFVKPLADATGVWFADGRRDRIAKTYLGTLVAKELKKLHARGGVVGGTGSGSAMLGGLVLDPGSVTADTKPGFGLLPGFLVEGDPAGRKHLAEAVAANPTYPGLGLDDGAAVVIRGRTVRVIGSSTVTTHLAKGAGKDAKADTHRTGAMLDLFQLRRAAANRAAKDPFPPARPKDPVVVKGSLVVVGGGGAGAEIWNRFIELAGGPDALIVVVPTAMEDPLAPAPGEVATLKRYGAKDVRVLHTRSRKEADDPAFSEMLTRATGVWFGGGRQWRFVDAYEGTLTERRFHQVLGRSGVIGGSSAGASIQSEYMPRGHPLGNTVMMAEGYERGFGFLPGCAVDQHFFARKRTADMTALMAAYPQYLGIGIDEGTAIVVTGGTAEVIGKSRVAFYDYRTKPDGEKDYEELKPGEKYDLKARKKVE